MMSPTFYLVVDRNQILFREIWKAEKRLEVRG